RQPPAGARASAPYLGAPYPCGPEFAPADGRRGQRGRPCTARQPRQGIPRGLTHMCGIVGYVGPREVVPLLLDGLKRLEYRGYDSAGVAVVNGNGLQTVRAEGK